MGNVSALQEKVTGRQVATQQKMTVGLLLESTNLRNRLDGILGKRTPAFISSVISIANTPALAKCEPMSIVSSAIMAATLDLPVNQNLGFAYIVPYKTKVKDANGKEEWKDLASFQIGWKGYFQLALRSNQYQRISATPVYEGQIKYYNRITDDFEYDESVEIAENESPIGYVAYYRLTNGFEKYLYMTVGEMQSHAKQFSKTYQKGYGVWKDNFEAMALKTVVKLLLSKYGILSIELQQALMDDQSVKLEIDAEPVYVDNDNSAIEFITSEVEVSEVEEQAKSV